MRIVMSEFWIISGVRHGAARPRHQPPRALQVGRAQEHRLLQVEGRQLPQAARVLQRTPQETLLKTPTKSNSCRYLQSKLFFAAAH